MKKDSRCNRPDYREFVFTATDRETDLGSLEMIDVYDNLVVEVDRLIVGRGKEYDHVIASTKETTCPNLHRFS